MKYQAQDNKDFVLSSLKPILSISGKTSFIFHPSNYSCSFEGLKLNGYITVIEMNDKLKTQTSEFPIQLFVLRGGCLKNAFDTYIECFYNNEKEKIKFIKNDLFNFTSPHRDITFDFFSQLSAADEILSGRHSSVEDNFLPVVNQVLTDDASYSQQLLDKEIVLELQNDLLSFLSINIDKSQISDSVFNYLLVEKNLASRRLNFLSVLADSFSGVKYRNYLISDIYNLFTVIDEITGDLFDSIDVSTIGHLADFDYYCSTKGILKSSEFISQALEYSEIVDLKLALVLSITKDREISFVSKETLINLNKIKSNFNVYQSLCRTSEKILTSIVNGIDYSEHSDSLTKVLSNDSVLGDKEIDVLKRQLNLLYCDVILSYVQNNKPEYIGSLCSLDFEGFGYHFDDIAQFLDLSNTYSLEKTITDFVESGLSFLDLIELEDLYNKFILNDNVTTHSLSWNAIFPVIEKDGLKIEQVVDLKDLVNQNSKTNSGFCFNNDVLSGLEPVCKVYFNEILIGKIEVYFGKDHDGFWAEISNFDQFRSHIKEDIYYNLEVLVKSELSKSINLNVFKPIVKWDVIEENLFEYIDCFTKFPICQPIKKTIENLDEKLPFNLRIQYFLSEIGLCSPQLSRLDNIDIIASDKNDYYSRAFN
ncbi:hypothetical protein [Photobacterium leiognathi]|uniref:hypothetical protein n=1 Tax=Photobacterium leiognathi TaxID=553611 RepID=UPI002981DEEF|nr:hypothetical protein [Photobacterium leiognathi]